jgi:E3 ubiquitin-protein ligase DOA10
MKITKLVLNEVKEPNDPNIRIAIEDALHKPASVNRKRFSRIVFAPCIIGSSCKKFSGKDKNTPFLRSQR